MCIDRKIRRVIVVGLDLKRRRVRGNGFLPKPDHGVDVRRHVPRVRHGRRNAGIAPRRRNSLLGKRRKVVGVNEVMRHARMLRVLLEEFLQQRRGLDLIGVGEIALRCRGLKRQRIKGLRLVVIGIALRHPLHRGTIGCQSDIHGDLVMVAEIDAKGIDPIALALRLRTRSPRFFDCLPTCLRLGSRRCNCKGVAEAIHRHAPIRHGATGVLLQDLFEFPAGNQEPVRMKHGDATVELDLHIGVAGGSERLPYRACRLAGRLRRL